MKIVKENHNKLIIDVLSSIGLSKKQAISAGSIMSYADEREISTHGILMLEKYVERIKDNTINKSPEYVWEQKSNSIYTLDGDQGMGHFLGDLAMKKAIEIAEDKSIGLVFVKKATHYGASGYYTNLAASHNMIGFSSTNTMPLIAPTGGSERILGNNPISFAFPRKDDSPIVLDIATSVVAAGKLILANQLGESIPKGWALDKHGNPTEDPYEGFEGGGTLLPIENHKGYGLSLAMDILTGILTGAGYGSKVKNDNIGFVMLAINTDNIMSEGEYNERLNDLISMIKSTKKAEGYNEIFLPGEIEQINKNKSLQEGISINDNLYVELKKLITSLGLSPNKYFD